MNEENTKKLYERYSLLFRRRDRNDCESLMRYGFSCGDGWFDLIDECARKLEQEIYATYEVDVSKCVPFATQVKEKFGKLRFYMSNQTHEMSRIIGIAEEKSGRTCEWCGKDGHDNHPGSHWIRTLCDGCAAKRESGYTPWGSHGV